MRLTEKIKSTDYGKLLHLEYWRFRNRHMFRKYDDYTYICREYKRRCGREINLAHPERFTEKLNWLKLFYRNDLMPILSDKYEVRGYLESRGFGYLLNELIDVYDNVRDFDASALPDSFVIKATHGSGWNLIVPDKSALNWQMQKRIMNNWLKQNQYWFGREWNYENQTPRIVVEKYLEDDSGELRDYKVFCMNGNPEFMQIDQNRYSDHHRAYIDTEGHLLDFCDSCDKRNLQDYPFGELQKKMFEISRELSEPFPTVRVDFYECGGNIYFGELTFFDGCGFYNFDPDSADVELGAKICLPEPNHNLDFYRRLCKKDELY